MAPATLALHTAARKVTCTHGADIVPDVSSHPWRRPWTECHQACHCPPGLEAWVLPLQPPVPQAGTLLAPSGCALAAYSAAHCAAEGLACMLGCVPAEAAEPAHGRCAAGAASQQIRGAGPVWDCGASKFSSRSCHRLLDLPQLTGAFSYLPSWSCAEPTRVLKMHSTGRQARLQDLTACHHQRNPLRRQPRWQAHARTRHTGPTRAQQQSHQQVAAFAPATIANLGPGFDWLGCAVKVRIRHALHTHSSSTTPTPLKLQEPHCH